MYYYDDIEIGGDLTLRKINDSVSHLIENDLQMYKNAKSPRIWECMWYNIGNDYASTYGYSKGDSVWINTQDMDEFVNAKSGDIYEYLKNYQPANSTIKQISSDADKLKEFYKSVINGNNQFDERHRYLYYIGDLSAQTQIRISKVDNNTHPPCDSEYWEDFIDRSGNDETYTNIILSVLDSEEHSKINTHLVNYHLSGLVGHGMKYENAEDFAEMFLNRDMSNQDGGQSFLSHNYAKDMVGFDYVTRSGTVKYENGCFKWFRKWSSGLLEHGGVVVIDRDNVPDGDSFQYGGNYYKVSLGWTIGTSTAPTYNYSILKYKQFYLRDDAIGDGYGGTYEYESTGDDLDWDLRYQLQITPMVSEDGEINTPYVFTHGSVTPTYTVREATGISNSSFAFKYSQNFTRYSYYTRGFCKNV